MKELLISAKELEDKIERELMYDVEDEYLHQLSTNFKKKILLDNDWKSVGLTSDGRNNIIFKKEHYYCIISKYRSYCFTRDYNSEKSLVWFFSEELFIRILTNLK